MEKKLNGKILFYSSVIISGYFGFLWLNAHVINSENIIIGFVQNLFTIPLMILQLVLLFICLNYWKRDKFSVKKYSLWAFLILLFSNVWFLGSYLIAKF